MSDIQKNGNDFEIVNGDLKVIENSQRVVQSVIERLQSFSHEWFLDEEGLPCFHELTGKNIDISYVKTLLFETIVQTDGVYALEDFNFLYDTENRNAIVNFTIKTVYNENRTVVLKDFGRLDIIEDSVLLDTQRGVLRDSEQAFLRDSAPD